MGVLLEGNRVGEPGEVLRACDEILKQSKNDLETQHVKVVALLNLDRWGDASRVFEECGDALKERARLEHAYTLYKVGELEEARKVAQKAGGRGGKHLEAQSVCVFFFLPPSESSSLGQTLRMCAVVPSRGLLGCREHIPTALGIARGCF
jgi:hypothetical protein